jgi:RimJ/RimL family protein N-acetyltransferase
MERIGFRKEGHFVKSLFWKNNWVDDVIYALLQQDWIKK